MNPWYLLGWLLVILFGLFVAAVVGRLLFVAGVGLSDIVHDWRQKRRLRRAHRGKVRCQHVDPGNASGVTPPRCVNKATHRLTGDRFVCKDHIPPGRRIHPRLLGANYAQTLEWAHHQEDK